MCREKRGRSLAKKAGGKKTQYGSKSKRPAPNRQENYREKTRRKEKLDSDVYHTGNASGGGSGVGAEKEEGGERSWARGRVVYT